MNLKIFLLCLMCLGICIQAYAQCPPSNLTISTQQDIINFQNDYPSCTAIPGNLIIYGSSTTEITDLSGLDQITSVGGYLSIYNNDALPSLNGLHNITVVNSGVDINNNDNLLNLTGLGSIMTIGIYSGDALRIRNNDAMTSLDGILALSSVESIYINQNEMLENIDGLEGIDASNIYYLTIYENPTLSMCNITAICSYLSNSTYVDIYNNAEGCNYPWEVEYTCGQTCPANDNWIISSQQQIDEFSSLFPSCTVVPRHLKIDGSFTTEITDLSGLAQITSVGGALIVSRNDALTNLNGLHNIISVDDDIYIQQNGALLNLIGLTNLTTAGSHYSNRFAIWSNDSMTSLDGISALSMVNKIDINGNEMLENIDGLANINASELNFIQISSNPTLSTCNNTGICSYLSDSSNNSNISNNAEGCNSREEVETSCSQDVAVPANDDFTNAEAISCGDVVTGDTTHSSLDEDDAPDGLADMDSPNVWYSYTGNGTYESITLSTCDDADFDTSILVYTGTSGNLTLVESNEQGSDCSSNGSNVNFESDGATTYYIAVEGWDNNNTGTFNLTLSCQNLNVNEIDGSEPKFNLYPNPTSDELHIKGGEVSDVRVYTDSGKRIYVTYRNKVIDTNGMANGIYVVQFTDEQGNVVTKKFIKK